MGHGVSAVNLAPSASVDSVVSTSVLGMAYADYPLAVALVEGDSWYEVRALKRELRALRAVNFSIQEQRSQALQRLGNMAQEAPFALATRFPGGRAFVCEAAGDWARKFQQIRSALVYKDLIKDDKVREHTSRGSDISDAQQAYYNALTAMGDQLTRMDGVYTQAIFEDRYGLEWVP